MGMELSERQAEDVWDIRLDALKQTNPQLKNSNAKIAYNSSTLFGVEDFLEALLQYAVGQGVSEITWGVAVLFNHNEYVEALAKLETKTKNQWVTVHFLS